MRPRLARSERRNWAQLSPNASSCLTRPLLDCTSKIGNTAYAHHFAISLQSAKDGAAARKVSPALNSYKY